jgi:cytoskeletal protein CcmA (bactofilin family)
MFKVKKGETKSGEVVAFLDKGIEFRGVLSFEGTIRVDGKVEGEIVSKGTLILGEESFVNGSINVGSLTSQGKIQGDVLAKNKISLLSGSTLHGNIKTPILVIEEGAFFEGQSLMLKEEKVVVPIEAHREKPVDEKGRVKEEAL